MKVGILTFQNANNYGALLQAYASQLTLEKLGHEACIINYIQPAISIDQKVYNFKRQIHLLFHPSLFWSYLLETGKRARVTSRYNRFREKLKLTSPCTLETIPQDMDCYFIGSDQLWNRGITRVYDRVYFGDFKRKENSILLSYAISAPSDVVLDNKSINLINRNFDILSVRENALRETLARQISKPIRVDLDPTLLTEKKDWLSIIDKKFGSKTYIAVYYVGDRGHELIHTANELGKSLGIEVINLASQYYSVEEFVSIIYYSQLVLTSSFHGTAFSIIFEKPFYSFWLGDSKDARYADLLKMLGLGDQLKSIHFKPTGIPSLNYGKITNSRLGFARNSVSYISSIVGHDSQEECEFFLPDSK